MIKHFNLKLDYNHREKLAIDHIAIGDLQNTIIDLLNRNTSLSGEIAPCLNDSFYLGGKQ